MVGRVLCAIHCLLSILAPLLLHDMGLDEAMSAVIISDVYSNNISAFSASSTTIFCLFGNYEQKQGN